MPGLYTDLNGKVVFITGGSRGIGAQTARAFAAQGAKVCVVGRDKDTLDLVVTEITTAGGSCIGAVADAPMPRHSTTRASTPNPSSAPSTSWSPSPEDRATPSVRGPDRRAPASAHRLRP
ncbi:SDR family NAD(P)-dependent oxidoreductase [Nocardioides sp. InS609-2]|uniref:SDR family NAD(P)-dependent oxidoreductase n=1 Tax=Nocardioides sp. InS609-2 TaxID=2760705 RepID=UPI0024A64E50|nr:SDR family NAD(P)-dependent oxidoreductase [Nocardioides sp. InS609-2]